MKELSEYSGGVSEDLALLLANDCEPVEQLNQITRDAARLFKVPIAMINLITSDEVITKACVGTAQGGKVNKSGMFCSYAVMQDEPLVVADAAAHDFFQNSPMVTGPLKIRSYAGKSLHDTQGVKIGTLCLFDTVPREYSVEQLEVLSYMAEQVEQHLATLVRPTPTLAVA